MIENKTLKKKVRNLDFILKLLWIGTFFSYLLYLFISYSIVKGAAEHKSGQAIKENVLVIITAVLAGISLISIIFSFIIKYFLTSRSAIKNIFEGKLSFITKQLLPNLKQAKNEQFNGEDNLFNYLQKCLIFHLISWGAVQNCALFAMVLSILSKSLIYAVVGAVFSGIIQFLHFPSFKYDVEIILAEVKE
jgi:hypothetical protein